ncbi:hypothetical protein KF840_19430 [bacterium]|nr:hypothetical protein [bacterium]
MTTPSITSITDAQKKQYLRFVEDAAEKALTEVGLDQEGILKLIENGDAFQSRIITAVQELSLSTQFTDEEIASDYGYLSGYQPKGVVDQIVRLRQLFPELGIVDVVFANRDLPPHAEGYFAIPRWEKIAPTYNAALEMVFLALSQTRNGQFYNWREGETGQNRLRQHSHTQACLKKLGDEQEGNDILIVPAQFGLRHRGQSARRAREVMSSSEFGLGAFAVGIMLLTHPERLKHLDDLWIDCAGDEYDYPPDHDRFSRTPCFNFGGGRVRFGARWGTDADSMYGSASGFVPQE